MSFRVDRRFNLLIMEEGEDYIADVAATMALTRRNQVAESKGRLRICSKSLIFQPEDVAASIIKFPYRHMQKIEGETSGFCIECEHFVQVATKTGGTETRIVAPFSILKSKFKPSFHVHYANAAEYQQLAQRLRCAASMSFSDGQLEVRQILSEVTADVRFDVSRLGHRETALLPGGLWVRQVEPLLEVRGLLQLSNEAIYFQPHPNFSSEPVKQVPLSDVLHVFRRVYGVQAKALEIITVHGGCLYLCFEAHHQCDQVEELLQEQRVAKVASPSSRSLLDDAEGILQNVRKMTALWQSGACSNFHYLDFLNCAAGRSRNDFSQYPVFPWVIADYTSPYLNLEEPRSFRDLSKPVGALSEKRLTYFRERMAGMPENQERFLYGTHYSTPAYVIYWLLRSMPERMLRLHNGHFDAWARLFRSVQEAWSSVNESTTSLMELIPEFFVLPAQWLENSLHIVTPERPLGDVELPRWASSVTDFICKLRAALESEHVSQMLPSWIDLIFGFKQSGEAAVKADNVFHPVCYAGSVGSPEEAMKSYGLPMEVLETQLQEFGRMPRQLFFEAHPPRLRTPKWSTTKLQEDAQHSEPWYKAVQGLKPVDARAASMAPVNGNSAEGYAGPTSGVPRYQRGNANGTMGSAGSVGSRGIGTVSGLRSLSSRPVVPFVTGMTGISCCSSNLYAVGEDGCLRVQPLPTADPPFDAEIEKPVARRNFRISPMPLSALAVLESELLALGGHDNTVSLYSTSCGSSLSKSSMHADTVTCLGVSHCKSLLVSGSRDQSVVAWQVTPSGLKNDVIFDDLQQPVVCAACSGSLVLAAASDKRLICWDRRSGQAILDRELDGIATACALSDATASASGCTYAAGLDNAGELRLWDLRQCSESLRLQTTANSPSGLVTANCFLTDFSDWAVLGGAAPTGHATVVLWDIPQQREIHSWILDDPDPSGGNALDIRFLLKPGAASGTWRPEVPLLCASSSGRVYAFVE